MRLSHFEALQPICPRCRSRGVEAPLLLAEAVRRAEGQVLEGALHCSDPGCRLEFPIVDGVPILVPDPRGWLAENLWSVMARDDLSPLIEGMVGDGAGPGSHFDVMRQHLSSYCWDHYGAFDPAEASDPSPGSLSRAIAAALPRLGGWHGAVLDMGCSVGRSSFDLAAASDGLVLGVDLNFAMLRMAQGVLRDGRLRYARRRVGIVYDRRELALSPAGAERVDFWCANALAPPFRDGGFGLVSALNLIDCLPDPMGFVAQLDRLPAAGGKLLLMTPFDWSPTATAIEGWIGGHSQRGPHGGAAEPLMQAVLTPGAYPQSTRRLAFADSLELPWQVRLHDRSLMRYQTLAVTAAVSSGA